MKHETETETDSCRGAWLQSYTGLCHTRKRLSEGRVLSQSRQELASRAHQISSRGRWSRARYIRSHRSGMEKRRWRGDTDRQNSEPHVQLPPFCRASFCISSERKEHPLQHVGRPSLLKRDQVYGGIPSTIATPRERDQDAPADGRRFGRRLRANRCLCLDGS